MTGSTVFLLTYAQLDEDATEHLYLASGWVASTLDGAKRIALDLMQEWHEEYRNSVEEALEPEWTSGSSPLEIVGSNDEIFSVRRMWTLEYKGLYSLFIQEVPVQD